MSDVTSPQGSHMGWRVQAAQWRRQAWRFWPGTAGLFAGVAIIGAHVVERVGGYPPCFLCFVQRWAFWAVIAASLLTAVLWVKSADGARAVSALLAVLFVVSAGIAAYHAGVEWGWWEGPAICSNGGGAPLRTDDVLGDLEQPVRVVDCGMAPFRIAGLSMAGWNVVFSLGLTILSGVRVIRAR